MEGWSGAVHPAGSETRNRPHMSGLPAQFVLIAHQAMLSGLCFGVLDNEVLLCDLIVFYLSATGCGLPDSNSFKASSCSQWRPWLEQLSVFSLVCVPFQVVCFLLNLNCTTSESQLNSTEKRMARQTMTVERQLSPFCYSVHWKIYPVENTRRSAGQTLRSICLLWVFLAMALVTSISKCRVWVSECVCWVK